jgi:hypothetical protein
MERTIFLLALIVFIFACHLSEAREWKDSTGRFSVDAECVAIQDGSVELRKTDGKTVTVNIHRLSEADREYLRTASVGGDKSQGKKKAKQSTDVSRKSTSVNVRKAPAKITNRTSPSGRSRANSFGPRYDRGKTKQASNALPREHYLTGRAVVNLRTTLVLEDPLEYVEIRGVLKEITEDHSVVFEHHTDDGQVRDLSLPPGTVKFIYLGNESEWERRPKDFGQNTQAKYFTGGANWRQ